MQPERSLNEVVVIEEGLDHRECLAVDFGGALWAGGGLAKFAD